MLRFVYVSKNNKEEASDGARAPGSAAPGRPKGLLNPASRKQTDLGATPNADSRTKEANALEKYHTFNTKYQIRIQKHNKRTTTKRTTTYNNQ